MSRSIAYSTRTANNNYSDAFGSSTGVLSALNVDSGVLYVDTSNNLVGVNKTNPSSALDVTGSVNVTSGVVASTITSSGAISANGALSGKSLSVTDTSGSSSISTVLNCGGRAQFGGYIGDSQAVPQNLSLLWNLDSLSHGSAVYMNASGGGSVGGHVFYAVAGNNALASTRDRLATLNSSGCYFYKNMSTSGTVSCGSSLSVSTNATIAGTLQIGSGTAKYPALCVSSGVVIDYGYYTGGAASGTITYAVTFTSAPMIFFSAMSATTTGLYNTYATATPTTTSVNWRSKWIAADRSAGGDNSHNFWWLAIGV